MSEFKDCSFKGNGSHFFYLFLALVFVVVVVMEPNISGKRDGGQSVHQTKMTTSQPIFLTNF